MKPFHLDVLKFNATLLSSKSTDDRELKSAKLTYYIKSEGIEKPFVIIRLEDTEAYSNEEPLRFYFFYRSLKNLDISKGNHVSIYPSIDIIVYSTVKVSVNRHPENQEEVRKIGFDGLPLPTRNRQNKYSPVQPKITLRRVHRTSQIPFLGSSFSIKALKCNFGFYYNGEGDEVIIDNKSLASVLWENRDTNQQNQFNIQKSWTNISFEQYYTSFHFYESSFKLLVYDQHYDIVDGDNVVLQGDEERYVHQIKLKESIEKYDFAKQLVSLPKYFDYSLRIDEHPRLNKDQNREVYTIPFANTLTINKSKNVWLIGSLDRSRNKDAYTNRILSRLPTKPIYTNYKDFLPYISISFKDDKERIKGIGNQLEKNAPKFQYEFDKSFERLFLEFTFSLSVGFTPIAGEAFDLYELYKALNDGEDAFGNKLTDTEKVITAVAVILPFISSGVLHRGINKLSDSFTSLNHVLNNDTKKISELKKIVTK